MHPNESKRPCHLCSLRSAASEHEQKHEQEDRRRRRRRWRQWQWQDLNSVKMEAAAASGRQLANNCDITGNRQRTGANKLLLLQNGDAPTIRTASTTTTSRGRSRNDYLLLLLIATTMISGLVLSTQLADCLVINFGLVGQRAAANGTSEANTNTNTSGGGGGGGGGSPMGANGPVRLFKRTIVGSSDLLAAGGSSSSADKKLEQTSIRSAKLQELDALAYLQRYGYMNETTSLANNNLISEDSFQEAIVAFQRFAGIPETGHVDQVTMRYMQMPRCGNKDRSGKGAEEGRKRRRRRRKRYALQGSKWRRQELTYRISQYPTRFLHKKHEVDQQIERAFKIWSQVAPIDFVVKKEGRVHIDIRFASGEHGDGDPFDGPGNTLAHAYFPQYGGDAHFDDQEYWTVDSYAGTNIFQVAAHELGHSLGLGHSSVREALMAPFYQKFKPNFKLHADDVLGIQALYGERDDANGWSSPSSTSTSTTEASSTEGASRRRRPTFGAGGDEDDNNNNNNNNDEHDDSGGGRGAARPVDLCQDSSIDAITRTEDGNTYVFRGQHYWLIKNEGLAGQAGKIARDWDGLPGNLDAALTWSDGKTFFFKGDKYWRYFNKRREPGYPKLISAGFAGIPNNVDAAFVWSGNGKTYFFKKDKYWRFDSKQEPPVSGQYPKSVKNWVGLPAGGVDAAFKWENGMTYFFKDDLYYRFDDREFEVDTSARPAFPRSSAEWWFGCTNSNLPLVRRRPAHSSSAAAAAGATSDEPEQAATALVFHRRPNLLVEAGAAGESAAGGGPATATAAPGGRSGGVSISRSIISSLSALFPSYSSAPPDEPAADWSFHRGVGEELRKRRLKGSPAAAAAAAANSSGAANTRWAFPSPLAAGGREQSMSELRMAPAQANATVNDTETSDLAASSN